MAGTVIASPVAAGRRSLSIAYRLRGNPMRCFFVFLLFLVGTVLSILLIDGDDRRLLGDGRSNAAPQDPGSLLPPPSRP